MTGKVANGTASELDTFLPKDGTKSNGTATNQQLELNEIRYKINEGTKDLEAASDFDPFKTRSLEHPVSDCDTLTHLLKAALGTGILSMPAAFKASGLVLGIFATIIVSLICTHCAYVLVICAHELYRRSGKTAMTYAEVAEEACLRGPKQVRKFAWISKQSVQYLIFVTYFATCSCYAVIVAMNFNYVIEHYVGHTIDIRVTIAGLLLPLLILSYVPNLKYLAPISMVANFFMAVGLGITVYYLVKDIPSVQERPWVGNIEQLPVFFSITVFAIEAIGVVMPLENHMDTPQHFVGLCGVLNQGMSAVTLVYIILGFLGYLRYENTEGSITHNLPKDEYAAQAVNILIALAVFCTFGLQFYVCLEIAWNGIKDHFSAKELLANYALRTIMVIISVGIAIAVPTIIPFVSLIGAFCFSILGLIFPVFIEVITFWDKGFGAFNWKIVKNSIVVITGVLALIFGSKSSLEEIISMYSK